MNERIVKLGLESHMLNYIDNETPRRYFLSAHADEEDLQKFAELIVRECIFAVEDAGGINKYHYTKAISKHFGVEE